MSAYVFDNAAAPASQRFAGLQASYDQVTIRQLEQIGVAAGWSCLEVGGGGGSIARWLARQVTPGGHVVVTDIDPRWLESGYPDIELRRHDIVVDELEKDPFDLAHERLVLIHLPERDRALRRMIDSLRPGGWLLIEDFDCTWLPLGPYGEPRKPLCSPRSSAPSTASWSAPVSTWPTAATFIRCCESRAWSMCMSRGTSRLWSADHRVPP